MTNEEFQTKVLEKLGSLDSRLDRLDSRVEILDSKVSSLDSKVSGLDSKVSGLDSKVNALEGQLRENTDIVKALMHRTEELDAKFDGLLNTVVDRFAVARLDAKIDKLETEIRLLKAE